MSIRPICQSCNTRPCAINYHREGVVHYRGQCDPCIRRKAKLKPQVPQWVRSGYKKKMECDKCGFKATLPVSQLNVFHVGGNLKNNDWANLKTICLNCADEIAHSRLPWKPSSTGG